MPTQDFQVLAFIKGAKLTALIAASAFVVSTITDNVCQIDKVWDVVPPVFAWLFAASMPINPRVVLAASLVTLWSIRLTYNRCRRGTLYVWPPWRGEEDYRWKRLRETTFKGRKWLFILFNLFFISGYQMCLIYLFTSPVLLCYSAIPLGMSDLIATIVFFVLLAIETIADNQMWEFQCKKAE